MNASFIDLQKTLRRPLMERLTPQRAPAHTQEEFDAAYTASFMRDPSILPLTCTCAEVYADCRYLAASALRTSMTLWCKHYPLCSPVLVLYGMAMQARLFVSNVLFWLAL